MLLGSDPVCELATGDAPQFPGYVCIPPPVPNAVTRLMIIDLAGYVDNEITQIINLVSLPQAGYPESVTFVPLEANVTHSPSTGSLEAITVQLETFTLPIALLVTVYTASGSFQTFRTC
jgi:hypothetical protein